MSLLEEAKKIKIAKISEHVYSEEDFELVLAWLNEEVGYAQVRNVVGVANGTFYAYIALACKKMFKKGILNS